MTDPLSSFVFFRSLTEDPLTRSQPHPCLTVPTPVVAATLTPTVVVVEEATMPMDEEEEDNSGGGTLFGVLKH